MVSKKSRSEIRVKKHNRLRNHLSGTTECPRLAVFRSNNHMYAQIIDDTVGKTLVAASTVEADVKKELEKTNNVDAAAYVGKVIAERAVEKGIKEVVFALSTTMEGDTTNFYIYRKLEKLGVKLSVIARGISVGDELEYADEVTLGRSIVNRTPFTGSV